MQIMKQRTSTFRCGTQRMLLKTLWYCVGPSARCPPDSIHSTGQAASANNYIAMSLTA